MTAKIPPRTNHPALNLLTRRDLLARGAAVTVGGLYLPQMLLSQAFAQSASFDYYISPTGSDQNAGTSESPWAITAINTKRSVYAGKRVGLLDGTYNLVNILGQPQASYSSNQLVIAGGATTPTVVAAVNRHKAIIDGARPQVTSGAEGGLMGPGGNNVTIDGLKFVRANYSAISAINSGKYVLIQNCLFQDQSFEVGTGGGKNSATIYMFGHVGSIIRNCRFEGGGSPIDGNRHSQLLIYNSTDCIVEYCSFIGGSISGNGIHFKATTDNKRMTVRYCYVDRTASSNRTSKECIRWHGNSGTDGEETCHNNVLVIGQSGAPFFNEGASNTFKLYNNTLVGGSWGDDGGFCYLNAGNPVVNVYNNIFSRSTIGWQGDVRVPSIARLGVMDNNVYDSSPKTYFTDGASTTWASLVLWRAAALKDLNSKEVADPMFTGTGVDAEKYKLQSASPARTVGLQSIEVGAWAGATQVGVNFAVTDEPRPMAPQLQTVS